MKTRILILHNFYQQGGGEDKVVAAERDLLSVQGHEVKLVSVANNAIMGILRKVQAAWETPYSPSSLRMVESELQRFQPDVVHVHNFFPLLTPSIYDACKKAGVPVVQTLHNYRTICPGAMLMRDGQPCEECVSGSPYRAVVHRCYRGSLLGTLAVARMVASHRLRGTWLDKVDSFIALTEFAKSKFVQAGFPAEKIVVKPNFVDSPTVPSPGVKRSGALFVGRLSQEKGLDTLIEAWKTLNIPLRVIGDGPLAVQVKSCGLSHVKYLGPCSSHEVAAEMAQALFLVVPSRCYEGFPIVIAEAFASGLPVLASRLGSLAEIVEDGVTGAHFEAGNPVDLAKKAQWAAGHPEELLKMEQQAVRIYKERYTAEENYRILIDVYAKVFSC